jgi:hypothetical protein
MSEKKVSPCQACETLKYEEFMNVKCFGRGIRFFPPDPPLHHICEKGEKDTTNQKEKKPVNEDHS